MTRAQELDTVLRQAVEQLQLMTPHGELIPLDSLSIVVLATELERMLSVKIPPRHNVVLGAGNIQSGHLARAEILGHIHAEDHLNPGGQNTCPDGTERFAFSGQIFAIRASADAIF